MPILVAGLSGCSVLGNSMPYSQLQSIRTTQSDCRQLDQNINHMEYQLKQRGIWGKNPEDLDSADRQYNSTAKIIIWSLRIGCNNTDRYPQ